MNKESKIYIAGHNGMVGSAIKRSLESAGYSNIIVRKYADLDLVCQKDVENFFDDERPEYVIDAAAKVGGILANDTYRGQFLYENLMIQNNVIHAAHQYGVKKLLFLGSSCIYPKHANQPMREESLLTGILESTNEPYAIAKIAGIKMCENYYRQYGDNFISVMPTNLYGFNDNYDLKSSHVLPALIRKIHEARMNNSKFVQVWGTGFPMREFLYVDDMANACIFIMNKLEATQLYEDYNLTHLNIGSGKDISIRDLALLIGKVVGFNGTLKFDESKPDGVQKKLLDVSRLAEIGWRSETSLEGGIEMTYKWFLDTKNYAQQRT